MSNEPRVPNPAMLVLARESRGMPQTELASRVGVSQGFISKGEAGFGTPPSEMVGRIGAVLGYPSSFFYQSEPLYGPNVYELFHRKRRSVPARKLSRVYALMNIRRIHISRLLRSIDIGSIDFWPLDPSQHRRGAADVAQLVRASWSIPLGPIRNLITHIEEARGIVVPFDFETQQIDAVSQWPPNTPPILLVSNSCPTDRLRFTLAHEIGHVFMHQGMANSSPEAEANEFAAEFLMPQNEIGPHLGGLSLESLVTLKQHWGVSMSALLKRATDLGCITQRHSRSLWAKLSRAGLRTHEPPELAPLEAGPRLLGEIVALHIARLNYTETDLAELLCLSVDETHKLYVSSRSQHGSGLYDAALSEAERILGG